MEMNTLDDTPLLTALEQLAPHDHLCSIYESPVVLSMHSSEAFVVQALRNGASAYVLKDSSMTELVRAVREVLAGRRYLSSRLSERAIEAYVNRSDGGAVDIYETLTTREREVLHLAGEGLSNPAIGERHQRAHGRGAPCPHHA